MAEETNRSSTQGGTHKQHVEAGKQSHKNMQNTEEAKKTDSSSNRHGPGKDDTSKGGRSSYSAKH